MDSGKISRLIRKYRDILVFYTNGRYEALKTNTIRLSKDKLEQYNEYGELIRTISLDSIKSVKPVYDNF